MCVLTPRSSHICPVHICPQSRERPRVLPAVQKATQVLQVPHTHMVLEANERASFRNFFQIWVFPIGEGEASKGTEGTPVWATKMCGVILSTFL